MSSIGELAIFFPGSRADKETATIRFKRHDIVVTYVDGTTVTLKDPVQVQDIDMPAGAGPRFIKRLRELDKLASKNTFYERQFLESVKKEVLG